MIESFPPPPVLVLPGFMADDTATRLLRQFLTDVGYRALPWELGLNRGPLFRYLARLTPRLDALHGAAGERVCVVGWSRGGLLARELARDRPDRVCCVVTLGTPVRHGLYGTTIARSVLRQVGRSPEQLRAACEARERRLIDVPITAIYSKTDGVVPWTACRDDYSPRVTHTEVDAAHAELMESDAVFRCVADALAGCTRGR